jgi:hypothetical protein
MVAALEVASVMISVIVAGWVILPLQPERPWLALIPAISGLALILRSQKVRGERPLAGARRGQLSESGATARLADARRGSTHRGDRHGRGSFHYTSHFRIVLLWLPIWGLVQQYVMQGFVYRRLRYSFAVRGSGVAIVATAVLFALAYAPNLMPMGLTLVGASSGPGSMTGLPTFWRWGSRK